MASLKRENAGMFCEVSGKRVIKSRSRAEIKMQETNIFHGRQEIKSFYKCRHCHGWHLTKMSPDEHRQNIQALKRSLEPGLNMQQTIAKRMEFLLQKRKGK